MASEWRTDINELAVYLAQDPSRRARVLLGARYEDEHDEEVEAHWSCAGMAVQFRGEDWHGSVSNEYLTRDITGWCPKREPRVLRGKIRVAEFYDRCTVTIPVGDVELGTDFEYTLTEVLS